MIIISSDLVLAEVSAGYGPNHPLVGWHNVVKPTNVTASSADSSHPASLLAYPTTYNYWEAATTSSQAITVNVSGSYDYVGIARHNFGTAGISVQVQGLIGEDWEPLTEDFIPGSNDPLMLVFSRENRDAYRLKLGGGGERHRVAVVYLGKLLTLPSRIYVGHTPVKYGRRENITTGTADSGAYLGRVFVNEWREGQIVQNNVNPSLYRAVIDPWVKSREPFFFAWRPESYPQEVGYVWRTGPCDMVNQRPNGMVQFSMNVRGIM